MHGTIIFLWLMQDIRPLSSLAEIESLKNGQGANPILTLALALALAVTLTLALTPALALNGNPSSNASPDSSPSPTLP